MSEQPIIPMPTIRKVPASHGLDWLKRGYQYYRSYALMWMILFVIYFCLMMPLAAIPAVGPIISMLLAPVFAAGMMMGCQAIERKQDLEINHLFAGFKHNTAQLVSLGGLYMLGVMLVSMVFVSGLDQAFIQSIAAGGQPSPADLQALSKPVLIAMVLLMPLMLAYWFAPVLVALNDVSAIQAMRLSIRACLINTMPFLMMSLVVSAIMMGLLTLTALLGPLGNIIVILAFATLVPIMMTSTYTSYRDVFISAADQ